MGLLGKHMFSLKSSVPIQTFKLISYKHAQSLTIDKSLVFYITLINKNFEVKKTNFISCLKYAKLVSLFKTEVVKS